jgi:hypothetical protein
MEQPNHPLSFSLCASCGSEVRMDYLSPLFGLCEFCEERVQQETVKWPVKEVDREDAVDREKKWTK